MENIDPPEISAPAEENAEWQELPAALPALGVLAGMSGQSLETVATYGRYENFPNGSVVIQEGQQQDRFYVVVSGKLKVSAQAGGNEVQLNIAETGECLGEVSLLEPGAASASVTVVDGDAMLWSMNLEDLRNYISEHAGGGGALLMGMAQCLSQRVRGANGVIAAHRVKKVESVTWGAGTAITAENTPVNLGFFDKLKKSMASDKKVRISDKIKLSSE